MIEQLYKMTIDYIDSMPKNIRKKYGQFFTNLNTAKYMASLFDLNKLDDTISILDPGAGTGILSCALLERINKEKKVKNIKLICYENDKNVLPLLEQNLNRIKNAFDFNLDYVIKNEDYLLKQNFNEHDQKYDLIIGNPPYKKILAKSKEALHLKSVCYGAPNLYFLFLAMSINNMDNSSELVYIIPRSWTSGAYFEKFRDYMLTNSVLDKIHLFVSRKGVFKSENVLQETIIIHLSKNKCNQKYVQIYSSIADSDIFDSAVKKIPYNMVVSKENYIFLPTNDREVDTLKKVSKMTSTLINNDTEMKTGLVVDFRNRDMLFEKSNNKNVPLVYSQNINKGRIVFPIKDKPNYVSDEKNGLIQKNSNYLIVKRFSSKEETRRLQCGILLKTDFEKYEYISTQNKVNFITGINHELSNEEVYGLFVIFNSTIYDNYYRILNGSTQVNSSEVNKMPIPNSEIIIKMGKDLIKSNILSTENCDRILEEYL